MACKSAVLAAVNHPQIDIRTVRLDGAKPWACPESRADWASKEVNHVKARKENGLGPDGPPKVVGNHVK